MFSTQRRTDFLIALLLALLAIAVRVPSIGWGLPDIDEEALPMKKALDMWGWSAGSLQLDPKTAGWPSLSFYIHLGLQHLQYSVGWITGSYADRYDYLVENSLDRSSMLLWARSLGVFCAGLVVFLTTRLAHRWSGIWGALLAGGTLALSPMLLRHAQLVTPDILLTAFSALALVKAMEIFEAGRTRDYLWTGLLLGLGIACKYTPVLFTLGLYGVHLLRLREEGKGMKAAGLADRRLWMAAGACVLAFVVTSPYTLSDLEVLRRDFGYQALHMSQGHFGQEHTAPGPIYYLREVLGPGLGWPALLLALSGLGLAAWKLGGVWRALVAYTFPFLLGILVLSTSFERYMLPALMPLALGLAAWPTLLPRFFPNWNPRIHRAAAALLLLICLLPPARGLAAYHREKAVRGTMQVAKAWMMEVLQERDPALAMESYTPHVPGDAKEVLRREPFFARLSESQQKRLMERPSFRFERIPMNSVRMELVEYYYELRHYLPFDYLVTSSSVRGRYEAVPEQYPTQMDFYADLDRFAELEREFDPADGMRGPRIRFYHFHEEGKQRLLEERGPLPPKHYLEYKDKLHAPQFFQFVSGLAKRAEQAERWSLAARYTDLLLDTAGRGSMRPENKLGLLERSAHAHIRAREFERGLARAEDFLELGPPDSRVLGYRGQALEGLDRLEEARAGYLACEAEARKHPGEEAWVDWARQRVVRVEKRLSER